MSIASEKNERASQEDPRSSTLPFQIYTDRPLVLRKSGIQKKLSLTEWIDSKSTSTKQLAETTHIGKDTVA